MAAPELLPDHPFWARDRVAASGSPALVAISFATVAAAISGLGALLGALEVLGGDGAGHVEVAVVAEGELVPADGDETGFAGFVARMIRGTRVLPSETLAIASLFTFDP